MSKEFLHTLFCAGLCILMGCQPVYTDVSKQLKPKRISLPEAHYSTPAWLDDDQIAFSVSPQLVSPLPEQRVEIYDLNSGQLNEIPTPTKSKECLKVWLDGPLARLPNGNLGVVWGCTLEPIGLKEILFQRDKRSSELRAIPGYPEDFAIGTYAFSPDMMEIIQENAVGPGLNNELYRINKDGTVQRLLADFQRAKDPAWSPDGKSIGFWGTEKYPGGQISEWSQIEDLARYPWDLYLMDADGKNLRVVLPKIREAGLLKWSPEGRWLAFNGVYQGAIGMWILDTQNGKMTRVWQNIGPFDWSPDGKRMVILTREDSKELQNLFPVLVDLPEKIFKAQ